MPELSPLSRRIQALSNGHNLEFVAAELNLTEQQVYDRLLNPLLPDPPSGGSGVALGASIAIGDGFRNVSFATPGPLSGLASWQAPIDADFYAVQVRASGFEPVAQVADVYVIRDDAHWQDFFWGDQNEVTQSLAVSIGAAAGAVTVTTFTAFVPAGWYLVGHGSDDMGFYGTHAIPVGPD